MADPRVSVVLCVRDGERHLRESLDSILAQTFDDFELVAVDDGSTDATPRILAQAAAADARVRVERRAGAGVAASLAAGCARAAGELVARMDADDVSHPERLERQVAFLDAHPEVGVLGTGVTLIDDAGRAIREVRPSEDHAMLAWRLLFRPAVGHPTAMFRRTLLERVGGYDPRFDRAEDYELWTRMIAVTRFANLPEPLLRYRVHDDRVTVRARREMREATLRVRRAWMSTLLGREPDPDTCEWLERLERGSRRLGRGEREAAARLWEELLEGLCARGILAAGEEAPLRADLALRTRPRGWRARLSRLLRRRD